MKGRSRDNAIDLMMKCVQYMNESVSGQAGQQCMLFETIVLFPLLQ